MKKHSFIQRFEQFSLQFVRNTIPVYDWKFYPIDFSLPWWKILFVRPVLLAIVVISEVLQAVVTTLFTVFMGQALADRNPALAVGVAITYAFLEILNRLIQYQLQGFASSVQASVQYRAQEFFLTVDPIHHTTKSSGQIISKIGRGSRAVSQFVRSYLTESISIPVQIIATASVFAFYDRILFVIAIIAIVITFIGSYVLGILRARTFQKPVIASEDRVSVQMVENLSMNHLIRSVFATSYQLKSSRDHLADANQHNLYRVVINGLNRTFGLLVYIGSTLAVALYSMYLFDKGVLQPEIAITLLITFSTTLRTVRFMNYYITGIQEQWVQVGDLWKFIGDFGNKTYPVVQNTE